MAGLVNTARASTITSGRTYYFVVADIKAALQFTNDNWMTTIVEFQTGGKGCDYQIGE